MIGVVYALVLTVVGAQVWSALRSPHLGYAWKVARRVRGGHVVRNLPAQACTILVAITLMQLPVLRWGWWSSIGGQGNVLLASVDPGTNLGWVQPLAAVLPIFVIGAIAIAAPVLAMTEELVFRAGCERLRMSARARRAVLFGAVHALMGIPLGAALALSIGGLWFTGRYLRAHNEARRAGCGNREARMVGVETATEYHIAWNWTLLAVALGAFVA